jgi:hypothetical protein
MRTEILIVTWAKDGEYLHYCLRSIAKFATGFSGVTIVAPRQEQASFSATLTEFNGFKGRVELYDRVADSRKWHLDAQLQKMLADKYCPEADFILHADSDTIFDRPTVPEDYFMDGKPIMLYQSYASLAAYGVPWQQPTERAIGCPAPFETMRRHPQVNPRGVYAAMRDRVSNVHKIAFHDYVLSVKPDFPWGISEHNVIGAFAMSEPGWKEKYHWIDVEKNPYPKGTLFQSWSHGPIDQPQDLPSGGRECPVEVFRRLGL